MIFPVITSVWGDFLKQVHGCSYRESNASFLLMGVYLDCNGNHELESHLKNLIDAKMWLIITIPLSIIFLVFLVVKILWENNKIN